MDSVFLDAFMPREISVVQRRLLGHPGGPSGQGNPYHLGLFLLQVVPAPGAHLPADEEGGLAVRSLLLEILSNALRFSDVVGTVAPTELLGVARDLDGEQAFQIAQRILAGANGLDILRAAGLAVRLSYVVYPLSSQPDLEPGDWPLLLDLARSLGKAETEPGSTSGRGILRTEGAVPTVPEADLVRLALGDLASLTAGGVLRLQRIRLLPGD